MAGRPKASNTKLNFWAAMNNVLITSLSKGQFPIACLFFIFVIMLLKMPGADVTRLALAIVGGFKNFQLVGYVLSIMLAGGWFAHTRWQRSRYEKELKRVVEERNQLQEGRGLGQLMESTEAHKAAKKGKRR
jgi:hypothetical protein